MANIGHVTHRHINIFRVTLVAFCLNSAIFHHLSTLFGSKNIAKKSKKTVVKGRQTVPFVSSYLEPLWRLSVAYCVPTKKHQKDTL